VAEVFSDENLALIGLHLFPRKTGLMRRKNELYAKEGYGAPHVTLRLDQEVPRC
jgi:hypothetical protein